jgi:hypothetical protein
MLTIGEVHRSFNGHRGNYHLSELPDSFFGCKRYEKVGIPNGPNPSADVFFISFDENKFMSSITGQRTIVLCNPAKRHTQLPDLKTRFSPNIYGGPPDWVVVQEGIADPMMITKVSSPRCLRRLRKAPISPFRRGI